ncbi:MAG: hypothetical protein GX592_05725, partial [Clostridiales bacterium]|nr:hypothetical protein [Clostridiales bacterium]
SLVMMPIIAISVVVGPDIIKALFMHGAFTQESVSITSAVFIAYAVGMMGFGLRDLLNRVYHSMQDTRTTMYVAVAVVVANIALNFVGRALFGVPGLALATSVTGTAGMFAMYWLLKRKFRHLGMRLILPDLLKILAGSLAAAAVCVALNHALPVSLTQFKAIIRLAIVGFAAVISYLLVVWMLKISAFGEFLNRRGTANDGRGEADHHRLPGRGRGRAVAQAPGAYGVLRAGKAQKEPERLHAGGNRKARAAGSPAAVRPSGARKDDARRDHRAGDGPQHTHHKRPRH